MTDYLLLYSGGRMPESEAEQAAVMLAWSTCMVGLGWSLKDGGTPYNPRAAKTLGADGSIRDGDGTASGYSIIQAESLDTAADLAKGCPVLEGGASVTVYETISIM